MSHFISDSSSTEVSSSSNPGDQGHLMLEERFASQSEVIGAIWAIVLQGSP